MSNVTRFRTPVCNTNADYAALLRDLANNLDNEDPAYTPKHMTILILDEDTTVQRISYGTRDFTILDEVGLLEWAKMEVYRQAG